MLFGPYIVRKSKGAGATRVGGRCLLSPAWSATASPGNPEQYDKMWLGALSVYLIFFTDEWPLVSLLS